MRSRVFGLAWAFLVLLLALSRAPLFADDPPSGTLVLDVKQYDSDVKLDDNIKKQLKHSGVEWGVVDDILVIPQVNKKFLKPEIPHLTRYGERGTLQAKPGVYKITCVGYALNSLSRDIEKVLSKNAFFNNAVMTFTVFSGKTTLLEFLPTIQKQAKGAWVRLKLYIPDLRVRVIEDGVVKADSVISLRTSSSVAWDDYTGPLK